MSIGGLQFSINGEPMGVVSFIQKHLHNRELPEWLKAMVALDVGSEMRLGGGALKTTVIRRIS